MILLNVNNCVLDIFNSFLRIILFVVFLSISFSSTFISSQRPIIKLLKWDEIKKNEIIIPKVGPMFNDNLELLNIASFYTYEVVDSHIFKFNLYPELKISDSKSPRLKINGSIDIYLSKKLAIQNEFEFDNKGEQDPHFYGVERGLDNGWVGYLQHSTLTYSYQNGYYSMGRGNPYFFNFNESLLLNSNFPPVEYFQWSHKIKYFKFDWSLMMLDGVYLNKNRINRYLIFHRYSINMNNWRIGFTEALLGLYDSFGNRELGYVMPASSLLETEENRGSNTNLMWLLDAIYKNNGWTFYGELLLDDYALDGKSPPKLGVNVGLGMKIKRLLLNLEFTSINRWTGNHCDSLKQWVENKIPIGHSMGADSKMIALNSYFTINDQFAYEVDIVITKHNKSLSPTFVEEWPLNVKCDYNFDDKASDPLEKDISRSISANLNYLFNEDFLGILNLLYRSDTGFSAKTSISYAFK